MSGALGSSEASCDALRAAHPQLHDVFVADDLEVDDARMKWPDFAVPANVTEVR